MKIGIQGEVGAYSEAAAKSLYGKSSKIHFYEYFEDVFKAVKEGKVSKGVIPIENSLAGSIHQNYDLLQKYKLSIEAETHLRVEHVLMGYPGASLKSLKQVRSHPQALSQCSEMFKKNKHLIPEPFYDTAGAAKSVSLLKDKSCGAIASSLAAKEYKLKIIQRNVENLSNNYTRFLGVSKSSRAPAKTKEVKTSISFIPQQEESGVLFKILGVFALRDINLHKIESRPHVDKTFEYIFYVDFVGNPREKKVTKALEHLKEFATDYIYYGSYPVGEIVKTI